MSKPFLELKLLTDNVENEILMELRKRKMTKDEAAAFLVKMRKEGYVANAVSKVLEGWF